MNPQNLVNRLCARAPGGRICSIVAADPVRGVKIKDSSFWTGWVSWNSFNNQWSLV